VLLALVLWSIVIALFAQEIGFSGRGVLPNPHPRPRPSCSSCSLAVTMWLVRSVESSLHHAYGPSRGGSVFLAPRHLGP